MERYVLGKDLEVCFRDNGGDGEIFDESGTVYIDGVLEGEAQAICDDKKTAEEALDDSFHWAIQALVNALNKHAKKYKHDIEYATEKEPLEEIRKEFYRYFLFPLLRDICEVKTSKGESFDITKYKEAINKKVKYDSMA